MIGVLVDLLYFVVFVAAGLASVRVAGIALNARDRRRHARCLKNIERLEIANGFRKPLSRRLRYDDIPFRPGQIIEVKPGAPIPRFIANGVTGRELRALLKQPKAEENIWDTIQADLGEATYG